MPQEKQLTLAGIGFTISSMGFTSAVPFVVAPSPLVCLSVLLSFVSFAVGSYMLRPTSRFKSPLEIGTGVAFASVSALSLPLTSAGSDAGCHG